MGIGQILRFLVACSLLPLFRFSSSFSVTPSAIVNSSLFTNSSCFWLSFKEDISLHHDVSLSFNYYEFCGFQFFYYIVFDSERVLDDCCVDHRLCSRNVSCVVNAFLLISLIGYFCIGKFCFLTCRG